MKLTLNCNYRALNGAEIVTVEKVRVKENEYGGFWLATLVDGSRVTAFGDEILVSA